MSSRRILILILAVALAGVAAFATYTYLSSADERANQGSALVNVLVLKHDVAKGTKGVEAIKNADIGSEQVPERLAPPSAITDVNSINQLVAITDFKAGALLQQGMFVDPTVAQTSFADRLEAEKGKHAISISVDQVHGVGGFITPGDYVNLIVEVKPDGPRRGGRPGGRRQRGQRQRPDGRRGQPGQHRVPAPEGQGAGGRPVGDPAGR